MMSNKKIIVFLSSLFIFVFLAYIQLNKPSTNTVPSPVVQSQATSAPTPNDGLPCHSDNGLPDSKCTPGAIDPSVTQDNINQTICQSGYTQKVRPSTSYTNPLKLQIMKKYGDTDSPSNYELDHLISLELGGDPKSELNLWPEPYNIPNGAHQKDKVENFLKEQVCANKITLKTAQDEISTNWLKVYQSLP